MGKRHKWADVIVAWSEGAEIEKRIIGYHPEGYYWVKEDNPDWNDDNAKYRIKSQPKELPNIVKQWLSMGADMETIEKVVAKHMEDYLNSIKPQPKEPQYCYLWKNNLHETKITTEPPHPLKEYVSVNWKCIGKIKLEQDDE